MPITHLAVTIGPIYDLMKKAKTVRELWVSSYFLSKLSGFFVENKFAGLKLLSPQPITVSQCRNGAGVYPDRVYWEVDADWDRDMKTMRSNALQYLVNQSKNQIQLIELEAYIKVYFAGIDANKSEGFFLPRLNAGLDALELENQWTKDIQVNIIENIIAKRAFELPKDRPVYIWRGESVQGCVQNAFLPYTADGLMRYPSIVETSTKFLKNSDQNWYKENVENLIVSNIQKEEKEDIKMDGELMANIKSHYKDIFKSHHKYICFVQGDGDSLGSAISEFVGKNSNEFDKISSILNDFSTRASQKIIDYGGIPIYAAGDDLLFYAPVKHQSSSTNTILHLLKELNGNFVQSFTSLGLSTKSIDTPTQSFGISISYYKHPMSELITDCYNLLFHKAKQETGKNAIAMKFQKHSGQKFELCLKIDSDLFKTVLDLVKYSINKEDNFINSITYKLDDQKKIIALIADDTFRLLKFFEKNFNESYDSNIDCLVYPPWNL